MKRLVITRDASQDLAEISDYFLAQSVEAGERFVTTFSQKCEYLAQYPHLGKSYAWLAPNLRGLSLLGYILFYQVVDDGIEILRVVSGYRNLQDVFKPD